MRHGTTDASASYLVNGDPNVQLALNETGRGQSRALGVAPWVATVRTCLTSRFPRARETADLAVGAQLPARYEEGRLDEVDYGAFEGGPWMVYGAWLDKYGRHVRPPGSRESLHEASARLVDGLAAALTHPGPRLIVGHGIMCSIVIAALDGQADLATGLRLPEAPYVTPVILDDPHLGSLVRQLQGQLARSVPGKR
ncbi:histidine phosphatase family protein [Actinokineospora terrae]|uniref:histidine phosphatase family protein n=1 Tax=Actinokineospora terrae TaxID=155974 RepID=UPI003CCB8DA8